MNYWDVVGYAVAILVGAGVLVAYIWGIAITYERGQWRECSLLTILLVLAVVFGLPAVVVGVS